MKFLRICFLFLLVFACQTLLFAQTSRVAEIQSELKKAGLDGWLFYDFRGSDPLAYRILQIESKSLTTRRWFYYVPATGEPTKIVHSIERFRLDSLPGKKLIYREWQQLHQHLHQTLATGQKNPRQIRVAMQYSPKNAIPYISRVDAGTIEVIRSFGVEPVTSADLVQEFEAVWTPEQLAMHKEAGEKIQRIIMESFAEIKRRINANIPTTEYDIQEFMMRRYEEENLTSDNDPPNVSVNANAANPHYQPTKEINSPIKRGDFVLFDVWAKLKKPKAIYADLTWVGYVGETVPPEYVKIWNIVRDARDSSLNFVKAAFRDKKVIKGAQADDAARSVISKAGYADQFLHRTGHSIGEEVHGNGAHLDNLETNDTRRLLPRTGFSIEPGIYLEGKFGVRSEIDVYVSETEAIVTAPMQTEVVAILK